MAWKLDPQRSFDAPAHSAYRNRLARHAPVGDRARVEGGPILGADHTRPVRSAGNAIWIPQRGEDRGGSPARRRAGPARRAFRIRMGRELDRWSGGLAA